MNLNKMIPTAAAEQGRWFEYDGARFLLRSMSTDAFQRVLAKKATRHSPRELKKKPELYAEMSREAIAEHVLMDWEGVRYDDKQLPCTRENKMIALSAPELREWITEKASELANFQEEARAEDAAAIKSGAAVAPAVG